MKCSLILLIATASLLPAETGTLTIHMILHAIGEERYEIAPSNALPDRGVGLRLRTTFEYTDRGNKRTTSAELLMKSDYTPLHLDTKAQRPEKVDVPDSPAPPARFFTILGPSPFAIQMTMMRYWRTHGRPALLPILRGNPAADPIRIETAGHDSIIVNGRPIRLERYTIANLMFGREILWMSGTGDLAAAMTFAGGLPMEAVRTEYEAALPQLYRSGVAQEMADLAAIGREVLPERTGAFAITGARLVDATGATPIEDSVVIVRAGRIAAAGPRGAVVVPRGMPTVEAKGKTLLPGLWEMHTHFSGVEFGPAQLAVGITTARDCGGEFDYLVAQRDAVEKRHGLGPRLLLAGLIDAGGLNAFGHVTAETPEEGRLAVRRYHHAGFEQIKLYTFLAPDVIRAITTEARRLGMTVTGHVPRVFNAYEGVGAGMDQINHLNYVSTIMRTPGSARGEPLDVGTDAARRAIQFLKDHHTVVDPTASWGEMASHSKDVSVESFEPGIAGAPFILDVKFRGMQGNATAVQTRARMTESLAVIGALHKAGVAIVPGSDTGLVGYGLLRELELYVQAGMTPLEAIRSATIVSARAMGLEKDSGTIEAGKRADLILVDGNPLDNIGDLRKVSWVIANGRLFDAAELGRSVGFHR
ncbi:MAG: amidohydrolase [Bryobacterales bacterium]|nr:amidohydrolase [Bryobacterales bacterium]